MRSENGKKRNEEDYLLDIALSYMDDTGTEPDSDRCRDIKKEYDRFFADRHIEGKDRAVFILEHLVAISDSREVWDALIKSYAEVKRDIPSAVKAYARSKNRTVKDK